MAFAAQPGVNEYSQCPYNKSHNILKARLQTHLVKCRKNYPDVKKVVCPFNSTHLINEPEHDMHVAVCEDRASYDKYKFVAEPPRVGDINGGAGASVKQNLSCPKEVDKIEDWSDNFIPSYNPLRYCQAAPILRLQIGGTPSERKAFRNAERRRHKDTKE